MLVPGYSDYYEYAVGGKTGYTTEANNTLVTMADNGNMKLVCVTLKVFPGHVYSDTTALLEYGFNNFQHASIDAGDNEAIEKILDTANVTIPSGFKLSSLDAKLEQVTGGNSTSFLDYTYEDNPVGRIKVQVNKNASFQEAEAQEEEAGGNQRVEDPYGRGGSPYPDPGCAYPFSLPGAGGRGAGDAGDAAGEGPDRGLAGYITQNVENKRESPLTYPGVFLVIIFIRVKIVIVLENHMRKTVTRQ